MTASSALITSMEVFSTTGFVIEACVLFYVASGLHNKTNVTEANHFYTNGLGRLTEIQELALFTRQKTEKMVFQRQKTEKAGILEVETEKDGILEVETEKDGILEVENRK